MDPHSRFLGLAMLCCALLSSSPQFHSALSAVLQDPLTAVVWSWPAWLQASPTLSSTGSTLSAKSQVVPPLLRCLNKYQRVLSACEDALKEHHDESAVTDALEALRTLVTQQPDTSKPHAAGYGMIMSPLSLSAPGAMFGDVHIASSTALVPPIGSNTGLHPAQLSPSPPTLSSAGL